MDDEIYEEPDDEADDDRCDACGEHAVEATRMALGGGMTETWLICQMCGHVQEEF